MRPLLTRDHYCSSGIFQRECDRIFKSLWLFGALRAMVARPNDFRTLEIAGVPVIIQNLDGRIRAFANICRHRQARIHTQEFGNRPLVCPYHNWVYDSGGVLSSVPRNAQMFQLSADQMSQIRLQEFAVETVGGLVFVNLSDRPMPISSQFNAETLAMLEATTGCMDSEYVHTRYPAGFNWKAGMENIKDPLHVVCLHRNTFPEHIKLDLGAVSATPVDHTQVQAKPGLPLPDATVVYDVPMDEGEGQEWQSLVERLACRGSYRGIHLFPNVNLMIVDGSSFSVQVYNPLSADCTEMQMMVTLTRPTQPFDYKPVVLWEHLKSDMVVLRQDIECLEALQKGLPASQNEIIHGVYETGIADFHSAYVALMEAGR